VDTVKYGELAFQEYFVHRRCEPRVKGFRFEGIETAKPAPGAVEAIEKADAVVFCPSNPWVSIDPILALAPLSSNHFLRKWGERGGCFAISPIIGGQTVKGPAAKMFKELGLEPSALTVARHYGESVLTGFILDEVDAALMEDVRALGIHPLVTNTLMKTAADRQRLAQDVLHFIERLSV
jgi:LPPG:FO 2-phospho-L-lactate transferase